MDKFNKTLLWIPMLILLLGTVLLLSGEVAVRQSHALSSPLARYHLQNGVRLPSSPGAGTSLGQDLKANRDSAYAYFLLGAGLLALLLLLPRLSEFSFSPASGVSVKVLREAQDAVQEATARAQAIAMKSRQAAAAGKAPEGLLPPQPDLQEDVQRMEESLIRLQTYTHLLEKISTGKKG